MSVAADTKRDDVVALYADPGGPYPDLVVDWYDEARDARTYAGPVPVVAHPPCGPWGRLRFLCKRQDASLAPLAVEQVGRWGGVLEHPQDSALWPACGMPKPGKPADVHGGRTWLVEQVAWGHACRKPTWLYVVGVDAALVERGIRTGGTPTHRITSGPRGPQLPSATKKVARRTPLAFAAWLLELAASARPSPIHRPADPAARVGLNECPCGHCWSAPINGDMPVEEIRARMQCPRGCRVGWPALPPEQLELFGRVA